VTTSRAIERRVRIAAVLVARGLLVELLVYVDRTLRRFSHLCLPEFPSSGQVS
jgi:hypothetical protein